MKTSFVTPREYAEVIIRISNEVDATGTYRPERFCKVMRENRGQISQFDIYDPEGDGMERKNPIIVALGDSVTAGHFEFHGNPSEVFRKIGCGELGESDYIEITDARECYLEKFRSALIDKYEFTSVSTINAGIAGDTMYGMQKRLFRDVIRYQPDAVVLNGSLNWAEPCGSTKDYETVLRQVVNAIKLNTKADIILLTPNMELHLPFGNPESSLAERVQVIREMAEDEKVCLADAYLIWEKY